MQKATILFDKNFQIGQIDKRLFGSFAEHLGRCVYDGLYDPKSQYSDQNGFRNDIKELIKELGITTIRYPGGNFVSGYNWKDGIGDKSKRPKKINLAWHSLETNQVGTNEFTNYLKELDIDMMMAVNVASGTAMEAGEFVDYCNNNGETYWSELRQKHGFENPHNFKLWCLGNEMDGEWQICSHTANEYARKAKETAKIMKWMDAEIELVACGTCTNEEGHLTLGDWDRIVLEEAHNYIDYLSLHRYYNYNTDKQLFYTNKDDISDIPHFFKDLQNYLNTIISVIDYVKGKKRSQKQINISFDEWGVITETGAIPGSAKQQYGYASFSLIDAIIYGGILSTFLNNSNRVKIACQSLIVNEGGMISTNKNSKAIRQATFYPFKHVATYGKGVSLAPITTIPKVETNHHGLEPCMTVSATYDKTTNDLTVFIMNCHMNEDIETELTLNSFNNIKSVEQIILYDQDPYIQNTFENEYAIVPKSLTLAELINGKLKIIVLKHSWNVLRFKAY